MHDYTDNMLLLSATRRQTIYQNVLKTAMWGITSLQPHPQFNFQCLRLASLIMQPHLMLTNSLPG